MFKLIFRFFERFLIKVGWGKPAVRIDEGPVETTVSSHGIRFPKVIVLNLTPISESIGCSDFVSVEYNGKSYWVLFQCPCGCGSVITLPRNSGNGPNWNLFIDELGYPTLYPSIWRNKGCCSHFWVRNGKVIWCTVTGIPPEIE